MQVLKLHMTKTMKESLDDIFIDGESIQAAVRNFFIDLGIEAKKGLDSGEILYNSINLGTKQMETASALLKDHNLDDYTLTRNEEWTPEGLDLDSSVFVEIKIGDNLFDRLTKWTKFAHLRTKLNYESQLAYNEKILEEMSEVQDVKQQEASKKTIEEANENNKKMLPSCFEEIVYAAVMPFIGKKIEDNERKLLQKENDSIED